MAHNDETCLVLRSIAARGGYGSEVVKRFTRRVSDINPAGRTGGATIV